MSRRACALVAVAVAIALAAAHGTRTAPAEPPAASAVVVEDWSRPPDGHRGIPPGWTGQTWGHPRYDFTVMTDEGRRALHLRSRDDSSTISKRISIDSHRYPILEWRWKAVELPPGGDSRRKAADDQAAQIYVVFPRFPEAIRSRIIGYVWDTTAPAGTTGRSEKASTVTYVIVRSGPADLGRWVTERRDVRADYRRIWGEDPGVPVGAVSIAIDTNDVNASAESYMGEIRFRAP